MSLDLYNKASLGCRTIANVLKTLAIYLQQSAPHHTTIRQWVIRNGCYSLESPLEKADDWVAIGDLTTSVGKTKCLAILGVRMATLLVEELKELGISAKKASRGVFAENPFCGSGTFLIEAAMITTNTPPGFFRKKWGLFYLPEHDEEKWKEIKGRSQRIPAEKGKIFGCDKDPKMVEICRRNIAGTGLEIEVYNREVKMFNPPIKPSMVVTNPPFGKRLESGLAMYDLSQFLQNIPKVGILTSDAKINIPTQKKIPLFHGGTDAFLHIIKS